MQSLLSQNSKSNKASTNMHPGHRTMQHPIADNKTYTANQNMQSGPSSKQQVSSNNDYAMNKGKRQVIRKVVPELSEPRQIHSQPTPTIHDKITSQKPKKGHSQTSCGPSGITIKKEKANWDAIATKIFCQVCAEEVHAGNRPNTHFSKIGWENVVIKFQQRSGRKYDYTQLKNRWEALKSQYKAWKQLQMETGLGWDHDNNTVVADPSWWEAKIEVNPEIKHFRERGPENLTEMEIMFSKTFSTGEHAWDPYTSQGNEEGGEENEEGDYTEGPTDIGVEGNGHENGEGNFGLENIEVENVMSNEKECNKEKKSSSKEANGKATVQNKSKVGTAAGMQRRMDRIVEVAESFVSPSTTTFRISSDPPGCSIAECMSLLMTLPCVELGSELYMLGARLFLKRQYREMFVAIEDDDVRSDWLEEELKRERARGSGRR